MTGSAVQQRVGLLALAATFLTMVSVSAAGAQRFRTQDSTQRAAAEARCRDPGVRAGFEQEAQRRDFQGAANALVLCPRISAELIAARLRRLPADSAMVLLLVSLATQIVDERIFSAALDLVADRTRTRQQRLAGLQVLEFYTSGGYVLFVPMSFMVVRGDTVKRVIGGGGGSNRLLLRGDQQLQGNTCERVLARVNELRADTSDDEYMLVAFEQFALEMRKRLMDPTLSPTIARSSPEPWCTEIGGR